MKALWVYFAKLFMRIITLRIVVIIVAGERRSILKIIDQNSEKELLLIEHVKKA